MSVTFGMGQVSGWLHLALLAAVVLWLAGIGAASLVAAGRSEEAKRRLAPIWAVTGVEAVVALTVWLPYLARGR